MNDYRPGGFSILPLIVKNLLIINGLFFVATIVFQNTLQIDLKDYLALYYPSSEYFRPYQLITHLFMHGNFMHLFSNMFALWMFGAVIENYYGPKKFLIYYVVTGLGAALLHTAVNYIEISQLQNAANVFLSNPTPSSFESFVLNEVPSVYRSSFSELMALWTNNPNSIDFKRKTYFMVDLITYG